GEELVVHLVARLARHVAARTIEPTQSEHAGEQTEPARRGLGRGRHVAQCGIAHLRHRHRDRSPRFVRSPLPERRGSPSRVGAKRPGPCRARESLTLSAPTAWTLRRERALSSRSPQALGGLARRPRPPRPTRPAGSRRRLTGAGRSLIVPRLLSL